MRARVGVVVVLLAVCLLGKNADGQEVTYPGPNMRATLEAVGAASGSPPLGDALASGAALEIATAPLASVASGLTFVYDPAAGTYTRLAETFGPAFAQRALTSGRGKLTAGVSWNYVKFDEVAGQPISGFVPFTSTGFTNLVPTRVDLSMDLKTSTFSIFGTVGVTEKIDVGVLVPITTVSLQSQLTQSFQVGPSDTGRSDQSSTGLADVLVQGKWQVWRTQKTAGTTAAPVAAVAVVLGARLPTGSEEDLRGLGFVRTKLSGVFSLHSSRIAAHANVGYEFWSDQLSYSTDLLETGSIETKGMTEVNAVVEAAITPRLTANLDLLTQQIRGAGQLGLDTLTLAPFPGFPGLTAESLVGLGRGLTKVTLAPGARWNVGGNALISAHVLLNVANKGLRAKATPVLGFDWTF